MYPCTSAQIRQVLFCFEEEQVVGLKLQQIKDVEYFPYDVLTHISFIQVQNMDIKNEKLLCFMHA